MLVSRQTVFRQIDKLPPASSMMEDTADWKALQIGKTMPKHPPRDPAVDRYPRLPADRSEESLRKFIDNLYRPTHDHLKQLEHFVTREKVSTSFYEEVLLFINRHRAR